MKAPLLIPGVEVDEWILAEDWSVYVKELDTHVHIPMGFVSDLDSVPRIPFIYSQLKGYARFAAIVHDFLYRVGHVLPIRAEADGSVVPVMKVSRKAADEVFLEIMERQKINSVRRFFIYWGVKLFGWWGYKPSIERVKHLYVSE